jgi:hypothetical protein
MLNSEEKNSVASGLDRTGTFFVRCLGYVGNDWDGLASKAPSSQEQQEELLANVLPY